MKEKKNKESSLMRETLERIWKNAGAKVGIIILAFIVLACLIGPIISPYGINDMDILNMYQSPSASHWFGTDAMGRDLLTRLLYGGRYSLALGICAAVVSAVTGCVLGSIAGYFGGKVETVIMRFLDIWSSLPSILLCILISAVLGAGFFNTVLALAVGNVPIDVRLIRGQILSEKSKDYLEAAESINWTYVNTLDKKS